jgi:hypothetical protein
MPSACYFEGDFWLCKTATTAGQSPTTHPAKWAKCQIPSVFRRYVIEAALAAVLPGEGKVDQARAVAKDAARLLDEVVQRHANTARHSAARRSTVLLRA